MGKACRGSKGWNRVALALERAAEFIAGVGSCTLRHRQEHAPYVAPCIHAIAACLLGFVASRVARKDQPSWPPLIVIIDGPSKRASRLHPLVSVALALVAAGSGTYRAALKHLRVASPGLSLWLSRPSATLWPLSRLRACALHPLNINSPTCSPLSPACNRRQRHNRALS